MKRNKNESIFRIVDYLDGFQSRKLSGAGNVLQFFLPIAIGTNGYVKATPLTRANTSFAFNYIYNYTDHLDERIQSAALNEVCERSSVRISYTKDPITKALKIVDEDHYYPFGLKHGVYVPNSQKDFKSRDSATGGGIGDPVELVNFIKTEYNYKYNDFRAKDFEKVFSEETERSSEFQDELGLNWTAMDFRNYDQAIGRFHIIDPLAEYSMSWSPFRFTYNNPVFWNDSTGLFESNGLTICPTCPNTPEFKPFIDDPDVEYRYDEESNSISEVVVLEDIPFTKKDTDNGMAALGVG